MAKSAFIHFQATTAFSLLHNTIKRPSYAIRSQEHNEHDKTAEEATEDIKMLYVSAEQNYKSRTKQKLQAKNILCEAVVLLEENHTLADLKNLSEALEQKTGYKAVQLSIHRDEGHIDKTTGETKLNLHGHIVFFTLDENGKSLQRQNFNNKRLMKELQTITADTLNMKRGEDKQITKAEHLTHKQYKQAKEVAERHKQEELSKWKNKIKEQFIQILQTTSEAIKRFFMTNQFEQIEQENKALKHILTDTQKIIDKEVEKNQALASEAEHYKKQLINEKSKHIQPQEQAIQSKLKQARHTRQQTL
jgi:hypothetical protein